MSIDIDKLEALTAARKKTWQALHAALGADRAASAFSQNCRDAVSEACKADEKAAEELYAFVRAQAEVTP